MNGEKVELPTVGEVRSMIIDSGLVSSPVKIGGNALSDSTKNWANDVHKYRLVKITKGPGVGQLAVINGNSSNTLVIRGAWPQNISAGATYEILGFNIIQVLRDVFGGGFDISLDNPLETHDPKVEDIEDKLDHPEHGLAALKALIDSLAGGAFYGSYGPRNVEVDNEVDFGTILYDPAGNIITVGEITPGTYTVHRVRVAVDTEIVAAAASSEAAGRVYMTYNFPAASWNVGDIFYITFTGIIVTADGITTEYPNLFIWGRVVREADISAKVDAVEAKLDLPAANETANTRIGEVIGQKGDAANETASQASAIGLLRAIITNYLNDGTIGLSNLKDLIDAIEAKVDAGVPRVYVEQIPDSDFALAAIDNALGSDPPAADAENSIVDIDQVANSTFTLRSLWVNVTSFGTAGTKLTFQLWVLINGAVTSVDSVDVAVLGIQSLVDLFGLQEVHADGIWITVITDSAGADAACSGTFRYAEAKI